MSTTYRESIPYQSGMLDKLDNRIDKQLGVSNNFEYRIFQILEGLPFVGKFFREKIKGVLVGRLEEKQKNNK